LGYKVREDVFHDMLILREIKDEFHYVLFSRGFVGGVIYDLLKELVFAGFVKH